MDIDTFAREGRQLYGDFATTVGRILRTVTAEQPAFRVQQIQTRVKGVASLRRKLLDRGVAESPTIELEVKDLAGCRLIFYTNADVSAFISSGLIAGNFEVDWNRTKFHYPEPDPDPDGLFISYNYVVALKPERLSLPEYERFGGMWCEVQVQTTLDHAWSEMAHDTIYKPPSEGFGSRAMASVERRMAEIMRKYLLPAGFDFQKVALDVRQLERGRELLASNPLKLIIEAPDNNVRHRLLGEFTDFVFPHYDDHASVGGEVRDAMVESIRRARVTPQTPIEPGSFRGVESHGVVSKALDIVDALRLASLDAIDATFAALCELAPGSSSEQEKKRLLESVETLSQHNMDVWRRAGPVVQVRLLELARAMPLEQRNSLRDVLLVVLKQALRLDVSGASQTAVDQVTFHQGAVNASDALVTMRRSARELLRELFRDSVDEEQRRGVLTLLIEAGRLPQHGTLTPEIVGEALLTAREATRFAAEVAAQLAFQSLKTIEHDLLWRFRHAERLPPPVTDNEDLERTRNGLRNEILAFRDQINGDPEFVIYKTLVGYKSVLAPAWSVSGSNIKAEQAHRGAEIIRLASAVSERDFDLWLTRIRRCVETRSRDGTTFPPLRLFLENLASKHPDVGLRLLNEASDMLTDFLAPVLLGLEGGPKAGAAAGLLRDWAQMGTHLHEVLAYCGRSANLDLELLDAALATAMERSDDVSVMITMEICGRRYAEAPDLLNRRFVQALEHLAARGETRWVNSVWFLADNGGLIGNLEEPIVDEALSNLVRHPSVDTHVEWVLASLCRRSPDKLVGFFGQRLRFGREAAAPAGYEAVPFDFHRLPEMIDGIGEQLVAAARLWFEEEEDGLFQFRGGALPARLFAEVQVLAEPLMSVIKAGSHRDLEFVLQVLRGYEGQPAIHWLCQEVVAGLPEEDSLLDLVSIVLDESGVVSGEFGFVEQHRRRREEMATWLTDPRRQVQAFARRRMVKLDRAVASEQRRSMEAHEVRKRNFEA